MLNPKRGGEPRNQDQNPEQRTRFELRQQAINMLGHTAIHVDERAEHGENREIQAIDEQQKKKWQESAHSTTKRNEMILVGWSQFENILEIEWIVFFCHHVQITPGA